MIPRKYRLFAITSGIVLCITLALFIFDGIPAGVESVSFWAHLATFSANSIFIGAMARNIKKAHSENTSKAKSYLS